MGPSQNWGLWLLCGLWLLACGLAPVGACGRGSIFIQNNGYRQILVAIGEDVPETKGLVDRIKEVFTATSAMLHQATRNRAHFEEIKILVPKKWTPKPEYEVAGNEAIDKSDILVDAPDSRYQQGDMPFVIKTTPCGELGHYMHITPNYLMDNKVSQPYGPVEKVLVHEWAHLRYGVFDEYPVDNDPHFYSGPDGRVEATRCSLMIEGTKYNKDTNAPWCNSKGTLPDEKCRWRDAQKDNKPGREYASLMYRQYLDHVTSFCDNDKRYPEVLHNPDAPNQQNRKCGGRSVWEVLRSHGDFEKNNNPPRPTNDTAPTFKVVQAQAKRYVLVLDVSGSMRQPVTRIQSLGRGCSNFIRNIVRDGEKVGVVWFNGVAFRAQDLTVVSNTTRLGMLDAIPITARGSTSIGAGLLEALKVFEHNGGQAGGATKGGTVILVSDGGERQRPFIIDVLERVLNSKVTVHSIAITNKADSNSDALAKQTGGLSFLFSDRDNSNGLNEAFRTIADLNQNVRDKKLPISSKSQSIAFGATISRRVSIDSTLGKNSEFIFDFSGADIDIKLISPRGDVYEKTSPIVERDDKFGIYTFNFKGKGETGQWTYNITNNFLAQRVAVTVVSQTAEVGKYPIMAQAYWGHRTVNLAGSAPMKQSLYASVSQGDYITIVRRGRTHHISKGEWAFITPEVVKYPIMAHGWKPPDEIGYSPVLKADVVALIERPDGTTINLPLKDSGSGADQTKDDGIYSSYFVDFFGDGRYNVKVMVNSNEATIISSIRVVGRGAPRHVTDHVTDAQPMSDERVSDLERTATGGSFELENSPLIPGTKAYPPGQVTDLIVSAVNLQEKVVTLSWTAPGAELDKGTLAEYEIRFGTDFGNMRNNLTTQDQVSQNMVTSGNLTAPAAPGTTETFSLRMPATGDVTYIFCVMGVDMDFRRMRGDPSNLASAGMKAFVPSGSSGLSGGAIAGIVIGVLVLVGIIVAVVAFVFIKRPSLPIVKRNEPQGADNKACAESQRV